jgi:hypothetical protein
MNSDLASWRLDHKDLFFSVYICNWFSTEGYSAAIFCTQTAATSYLIYNGEPAWFSGITDYETRYEAGYSCRFCRTLQPRQSNP